MNELRGLVCMAVGGIVRARGLGERPGRAVVCSYYLVPQAAGRLVV